jgi:primosomal protein N' (replication factor Y)
MDPEGAIAPVERYADVIVDAEVARLPQPFTYRIPTALHGDIGIGSCVLVPFAGRDLLGYVVALHSGEAGLPQGLKDIRERVEMEPLFDRALADLAAWVARYYHTDRRDGLRPLIPKFMASSLRTVVALSPPLREIIAYSRILNAGQPVQLFFEQQEGESVAGNVLMGLPVKVTPKQRLVLQMLSENPAGVDLQDLKSRYPGGNVGDVLKRLRDRGLVVVQKSVLPPPVKPRRRKAYRFVRRPGEEEAKALRITPKQDAVLATMERQKAMDLGRARPILGSELGWRTGAGVGVMNALVEKGLVEATTVEVRRDPWPTDGKATAPRTLTPDQQAAFEAITESVDRNRADRFLLHGVTASGKTEVYLQSIQAALDANRQAIVLVPEISLTAQVMDIFQSRFGGRVAVLHSALSDGERYDEWRRIRHGEAMVVVGARSGIFAPLARPGLIILDEEHESSYKQDQTPRYHARTVAARRARACGATLVLGSATPSVETCYLAEQGRLKLLEMPSRIDDRPLPPVEVVDQRQPAAQANGLFSPRLEEAIRERLGRSEQTILFLNRRGFSASLLCRDCGYVTRCQHCSVSMTYHHPGGSRRPFLQCHHCDHREPAPSRCPGCGGDRIRHYGLGTEKVELETRNLFPEARVLRLDRDTTARKDAHRRILTRFRNEDADILIGTQMVAKGLDFPRVTLVGVIAADTGLYMPDFRAAEKTFQLLTQVSGRAGRADLPGEVVVQTFNPEHYALVAAQKHDFRAFYRDEIQFRRELRYPPFSVLANVLATAGSEAEAQAAIDAAALAFKTAGRGGDVELLGPTAAPIARLKNRFRRHLLLRAGDANALGTALDEGLSRLDDATRLLLTIDVDPVSLL